MAIPTLVDAVNQIDQLHGKRRPRNWGLDALRGIAVVLMVQQHLGLWLVDFRSAASSPTLIHTLVRINLLGGLAAPLFVVLTGVGAALALCSAPAATAASTAMRRRGIALFGAALLLNLLTPNWFSVESFYVLHLIAVFWFIAPGLRRLSGEALAGLSLAAALGGLIGQKLLKTPLLLTNQRMSDGSLPGGPLRLALFEGHFPLFPWLALAISGFIVGRLWLQASAHADRFAARADTAAARTQPADSFATQPSARSPGSFLPARAWMSYLLIAGAGAGLMLWQSAAPRVVWRLRLRHLTSFSFYPATTAFVLVMAAGCSLLAWGALWMGSRGGPPLRNPLVGLGRLSLTILVTHVVVFRQLTAGWGINGRLHPLATLLTIVEVLLTFVFVERAWAPSGYRFSLEWLLRRAGSSARDVPSNHHQRPGP